MNCWNTSNRISSGSLQARNDLGAFHWQLSSSSSSSSSQVYRIQELNTGLSHTKIMETRIRWDIHINAKRMQHQYNVYYISGTITMLVILHCRSTGRICISGNACPDCNMNLSPGVPIVLLCCKQSLDPSQRCLNIMPLHPTLCTTTGEQQTMPKKVKLHSSIDAITVIVAIGKSQLMIQTLMVSITLWCTLA